MPSEPGPGYDQRLWDEMDSHDEYSISEALMTAYYGILVVSPHLSYGMALLLRGCSSIHYTRAFRLEKLAVRMCYQTSL